MECDGAAIAYEINGEGPPVGYAHGLFVSRRMERWLRLADWTAVRRGRRFLEYDARGHGLTGGRLVSDDYVWPNLARDLLAFGTSSALVTRSISSARPWAPEPCCGRR